MVGRNGKNHILVENIKFKFSHYWSYNLWAIAALGISLWRFLFWVHSFLPSGCHSVYTCFPLPFPLISLCTLNFYQLFCWYFPPNKKFFISNKLSSCHFYSNLIMPLKLYSHNQSLQNKSGCLFYKRLWIFFEKFIYFELAMEYRGVHLFFRLLSNNKAVCKEP